MANRMIMEYHGWGMLGDVHGVECLSRSGDMDRVWCIVVAKEDLGIMQIVIGPYCYAHGTRAKTKLTGPTT